jgi:hypothetical protein
VAREVPRPDNHLGAIGANNPETKRPGVAAGPRNCFA